MREKLKLRDDATTVVRCSNDRPNIELLVEEMRHPASSFYDLRRVLCMDQRATPPKFMVFLNKRRDSEKAVEEMWKELPQPLHHKLVWFHSGMSTYFKEKTIEQLRSGEIWGLICTDAAGMVCVVGIHSFVEFTFFQGLDLPDVEVVVQLRYVPSLCTLMQRLGRGARGPGTTARGIYLVEPVHFDRNKAGKRRRGISTSGASCSAQKVRVVDGGGHSTGQDNVENRIIGEGKLTYNKDRFGAH